MCVELSHSHPVFQKNNILCLKYPFLKQHVRYSATYKNKVFVKQISIPIVKLPKMNEGNVFLSFSFSWLAEGYGWMMAVVGGVGDGLADKLLRVCQNYKATVLS